MKVTDHIIKAAGRTLFSYEVLPPLKGGKMQDIFNILDPLMEHQPPFIDVTYHREEYIYSKRPSGYYEKIAIRKRPGTVGICASIMHRYGVDAVPHLICGGFSKSETENALIDLRFLGIDNVLALRGDARQFEDKFIPEQDGHKYAVDLVAQVQSVNNGNYLDQVVDATDDSAFCIGVAGYPEKHFEAPNYDFDIKMLKAKVDAGADYIVTQMFFDNKKFFAFRDACRKHGINVPIIPGLKPVTRKYQLSSVPRKFFVNFPDDLVAAISKAQTKEAVRQVGVEWAIAQCKELIQQDVPCIHFYTMGDTPTTLDIVTKI
jgi:methylenetetrahydrofolate reductase (NADPH)